MNRDLILIFLIRNFFVNICPNILVQGNLQSDHKILKKEEKIVNLNSCSSYIYIYIYILSLIPFSNGSTVMLALSA